MGIIPNAELIVVVSLLLVVATVAILVCVSPLPYLSSSFPCRIVYKNASDFPIVRSQHFLFCFDLLTPLLLFVITLSATFSPLFKHSSEMNPKNILKECFFKFFVFNYLSFFHFPPVLFWFLLIL